MLSKEELEQIKKQQQVRLVHHRSRMHESTHSRRSSTKNHPSHPQHTLIHAHIRSPGQITHALTHEPTHRHKQLRPLNHTHPPTHPLTHTHTRTHAHIPTPHTGVEVCGHEEDAADQAHPQNSRQVEQHGGGRQQPASTNLGQGWVWVWVGGWGVAKTGIQHV